MKTTENRFFLSRKSCNLTQQQVANILQVRDTAVSKWECGKTLPDGRMLKKVAELYGVSADYLLDLTEPNPQLFDNARIERPEILELYDELTPAQQQNLLNYARGMAVSNSINNEFQSKKRRA